MAIKEGLVKQVKAQEKEREEQERLREKYKVDENVRIVEKSSNFKFAVKVMAKLWYIVVNVVLYILALIGALAIIYPETRQGVWKILEDILTQLEMFLR